MMADEMACSGAPTGKPHALRKDVVLAMLATPAGLAAAVLASVGAFDLVFWSCSAIFVFCVALANVREAIVAVPLLYAGVRLVVGALAFRRPAMLLVGTVCLVAVWGLAQIYERRH
jgi:hypothetical protein